MFVLLSDELRVFDHLLVYAKTEKRYPGHSCLRELTGFRPINSNYLCHSYSSLDDQETLQVDDGNFSMAFSLFWVFLNFGKLIEQRK